MDYLRQLFQLIFAISVMYVLLDCNDKLKKNRFKVGIYATVVTICDAFVLYHVGYTRFMNLYPVLVHIPVLLAFVFVSKFRFSKVLFVHFTIVAITITFTTLGFIVSYFFGSNTVVINIVCYILYLPSWFLIYKHIRPAFLYMMRNTDKGWIGFCIIPLSYTLLLDSIGTYIWEHVSIKSIIINASLCCVLAFASYYMILRFFKLTREQLTLQNEQEILKSQVLAAQMRLEALKESQEKTIIYRHDMRHHLKLIDNYLTDDNKAAAHKYITAVGNAIEETVVEQYSSNYTLNLILSSYIAKAKKEDIKVFVQIELPESSTVSDMDLCVILSNAIENATNACKCILNIENRSLSIICKSRSEKLFIQITNSFDGKVEFAHDLPVSTVENHGFGIKSIVAVVQKYEGVYSFTAADGVFCTSIIL